MLAALGFALCLLLPVCDAHAITSADPGRARLSSGSKTRQDAIRRFEKTRKPIDQPNPKDWKKARARQEMLEKQIRQLRSRGTVDADVEEALRQKEPVTDRVLVILVEFAGTDTMTWDPADSAWDPYGKLDPAEDTGGDYGWPASCANILTEKTEFTYSGPLHNQMPRPLNEQEDFNGQSLVDDFSPQHYYDLIFGNGVKIEYTRQDGTTVSEDFTGQSVASYYREMSGGMYNIVGEVVGWVQVNHSSYYYGADYCPGAKSAGSSAFADGAADGAPQDLVRDALEAVKAAYPDFDWASYDLDGDGVIDRLWFIHAGYGEEASESILALTDYGEGAIWSHSSQIPYYEIVPGVYAGPYIMNPEDAGIAVLAHEMGHNLGADDLYSYGDANTSAGFWTLMADSWCGYPLGFAAQAMDPWHLDNWGFLDPKLIVDPSGVYNVVLGQAGDFPGGDNVYRAAKVALEDGQAPRPVRPDGSYQWWGGAADQANAAMTMAASVDLAGPSASLNFDLAYQIEEKWDFLWVQVSDDGGASWNTLVNANTQCDHYPDWIGELNGFPADLCGAGLGGFYGTNPQYPSYETQTFDLSAYAGKSILVRFWYMTDWGTLGEGPFIDNVTIVDNGQTAFSDGAESEDGKWSYDEGWSRVGIYESHTHNYYLQWRNVGPDGGVDRHLGDARFRYQANSGLLVWYNNNYYTDNELDNYLHDYPGFGPKGRMLAVDSHPEPYRDPYWTSQGINCEAANLHDNLNNNRYNHDSMRDAPFSLNDTIDFVQKWPYANQTTSFSGRPAVSLFDDSLGYCAGAEFVDPGPDYKWTQDWLLRQYDASVAIPSTEFYGIKAPGYTAGEYLGRHCQFDNDGRFTGDSITWTILNYDGGSGNPGDAGGAYGWKFQVLSQSDTQAVIGIWNDRYTAPNLLTAAASGSGGGVVSSSETDYSSSSFAAMVPANNTVTLSATPDEHSVFAGWSGGGCSGTGDCQVLMDDATDVTAIFEAKAPVIPTLDETGVAIFVILLAATAVVVRRRKKTNS